MEGPEYSPVDVAGLVTVCNILVKYGIACACGGGGWRGVAWGGVDCSYSVYKLHDGKEERWCQ